MRDYGTKRVWDRQLYVQVLVLMGLVRELVVQVLVLIEKMGILGKSNICELG